MVSEKGEERKKKEVEEVFRREKGERLSKLFIIHRVNRTRLHFSNGADGIPRSARNVKDLKRTYVTCYGRAQTG